MLLKLENDRQLWPSISGNSIFIQESSPNSQALKGTIYIRTDSPEKTIKNLETLFHERQNSDSIDSMNFYEGTVRIPIQHKSESIITLPITLKINRRKKGILVFYQLEMTKVGVIAFLTFLIPSLSLYFVLGSWNHAIPFLISGIVIGFVLRYKISKRIGKLESEMKRIGKYNPSEAAN